VCAAMTTDFDRGEYLTVEQVADLWGVKPAAVRKAIRANRLTAKRAPGGRRYWIHQRDAMLRSTDQK
jgi:excisionase family DNA binding protein